MEKSVLKILDVLYDTAIERESWPSLIKTMAEPVGGVTGHLLTWDKQSGLIPHYEVYSMDDSAMESYASHWVLEDPRAHYFMANPHSQIFSDDQIVSAAEKQKQAFFSEWEHQDTAQRYVVGNRVHQSTEREVIFSLGFGKTGDRVRDDTVRLFQQLGSHLKRAVEIHQLFGKHLVKQTPEMQILDGLKFGVVFLDEQGRPGYYNRVAEQISTRGDGLRLHSTGLRARDRQSNSHLDAMVRACRRHSKPGQTAAGGWISITRDGPGPDYAALVIPMPEVNDLRYYSSPSVLVLISDPVDGRDDVGAALRKLYHLTEGEVRVALALISGQDVKDIAESLAVSREAVRYHLKNIFSKTGVNRQSELIRTALALPTASYTTDQ